MTWVACIGISGAAVHATLRNATLLQAFDSAPHCHTEALLVETQGCGNAKAASHRHIGPLTYEERLVEVLAMLALLLAKAMYDIAEREEDRNALAWILRCGAPMRHWWHPDLAHIRQRYTRDCVGKVKWHNDHLKVVTDADDAIFGSLGKDPAYANRALNTLLRMLRLLPSSPDARQPRMRVLLTLLPDSVLAVERISEAQSARQAVDVEWLARPSLHRADEKVHSLLSCGANDSGCSAWVSIAFAFVLSLNTGVSAYVHILASPLCSLKRFWQTSVPRPAGGSFRR